MTVQSLLIGATGTVGSAVAREMVSRNQRVRALVRSPASAALLPQGVEAVSGDLRDEASVRRALMGVRSVLFVAPHEPDEETLARTVVRACEAHGTRLVLVGVHADGSTRLGRALKRFTYSRIAPHYAPKFRLSEHVRAASRDAILLNPANFFQNDELFRREIEAGTFPQPFSRPMNRVDVRDVAVAAARALTDMKLPSGAYPVFGPQSLTGEQCAQLWSAALGKEVRCERDGDRVDAAMTRALPGKKREDFIATYRILSRVEVATVPKQLAQTTALLGRAPKSYQAYVQSVAEGWRQARRAAGG